MAKRQKTAFPPNFVHSLDGSHMMMTAVACRRAGLNFAGSLHFSFTSLLIGSFISVNLCEFSSVQSWPYLFLPCLITGVHDSYWTHACDVDVMNRLLREKFVELYEAPILENVSISPHVYLIG